MPGDWIFYVVAGLVIVFVVVPVLVYVFLSWLFREIWR